MHAEQGLNNRQKELHKQVFFLTFGVILLAFLPFIVQNRGYFIYMGDYNTQQIPFYQLVHDALRNGKGLWSWNTDLGANLIGSYTYYNLCSPFFWLMLPFPNSWVPYMMGPMLALKIALAALTAYIYIRRYTKTPFAAMIGSLTYALSGWSIFNIFFNQFHEAMFIFPLVLWAMDAYVEDKRRGVFGLIVAAAAIINYYFFFGIVVFAILYFVIKTVTKSWKMTWKTFLGMFFEAAVGTGMAAVVLIPSALAIMDMPRMDQHVSGIRLFLYKTPSHYIHILYSMFFAPEAPAIPVCFGEANTMWSSCSMWLPIFGIVGALAYTLKNKKHWTVWMMIVTLIIMFVPVLNSAFNLFTFSGYMRWYFMPILILSLMTAKAFDEDSVCSFKKPYIMALVPMVAFALIYGFTPHKIDGKWVVGLYKHDDTGVMYGMKFWVIVGVSFLSMLFLAVLIYYFRRNKTEFKKYTCVTLATIVFGLTFVIVAFGKSHDQDANSYYIDKLIEGHVELPDMHDGDRIAGISNNSNLGMYLGYPSASSFHSIVPASITEVYSFCGDIYTVDRHMSSQQTALLSLVSTKYILWEESAKMLETCGGEEGFDEKDLAAIEKYGPVQHYGYTRQADQNGYEVYKNENYIPLGFTYKTYIRRSNAEKLDEDLRDDLMLKALILDDAYVDEHKELLQGMTEITDPHSFTYSEKDYEADCTALKQANVAAFTITKTGFTAKSTSSGLTFFSVPYDKGWSVKVNGKPAEVIKSNVGFMSVYAEENADIEFTYFTPGLKEGVIISGICLALMFIWGLVWHTTWRKKIEQ